MKLELIDIFSNSGAVKRFEGDLNFDGESLDEMGVSFEGPVHVKGRAENIGGQVEISANVTAKIATNCARCMKDIFKDVDFDYVEKLAGSGVTLQDGDDVILLEGTEVDIADLTLNNFITVSPMKYLCKEDCKGLCPHCGADRNHTDCDCENDITDPRFDVLNNLFK